MQLLMLLGAAQSDEALGERNANFGFEWLRYEICVPSRFRKR
jgi:hypothetical protein